MRLIKKKFYDYFIKDLTRLNSQYTVINLGANIGNFSEIMAKTGANVIAFEPSSRVFEQQKKVLNMHKVLVTGTAGFIGFHMTKRLVFDGYVVIGIDIINDYYDINLKYSRLETLGIEKE